MANLKKHIQKRYLVEKKVDEKTIKNFQATIESIPVEQMGQLTKIPKNKAFFIAYTSNTVVLATHYKVGEYFKFIPIPDPVLMYFNNAYYNFRQVQIRKKDILEKLTAIKQEDILNELYAFFANATGVIIYLFTTLEAFVNRAIPSTDFEYIKKSKSKTEVYNKSQIEKYVRFDEKVNDVLAQVYKDKKKPFAMAHPPTYVHIGNLKQMRDAIIHLKSSTGEENQIGYEEIFRKLMDYRYEEALNAVKEYCNYYHFNPEYISECTCNNQD